MRFIRDALECQDSVFPNTCESITPPTAFFSRREPIRIFSLIFLRIFGYKTSKSFPVNFHKHFERIYKFDGLQNGEKFQTCYYFFYATRSFMLNSLLSLHWFRFDGNLEPSLSTLKLTKRKQCSVNVSEIWKRCVCSVFSSVSYVVNRREKLM